ncbi:hypothetical protein ABFU82_17675 [Nocardioides sp. WV_118_6]
MTPDFVIEFNMGSEEVVDSVMLHVRGEVLSWLHRRTARRPWLPRNRLL